MKRKRRIINLMVVIFMSVVWLGSAGAAWAGEGIPIAQADPPEATEAATPPEESSAATTPEQASQFEINDFVLWIMISIGGMVGGLLFGMRDKTLVMPHPDKRSQNIYNPGFLVDLLFGLLGGFVIFMVVPGDFNVGEGGFVVVKILALAGIGGYGGRALIETVLQKQLQEIKNQIQDMQDKSSIDAKAMSLLNQQLDHDPSTNVDEAELKDVLLNASSNVLVAAFSQARGFRRDALRDDKRADIPQVIPIFEALIAADERDNDPQKYHRNYGQLGYALKDKADPDNPAAIKAFTDAIKTRDLGDDKNSYRLYELNRAICRIRVKADFAEIKADLDTALGWPKSAKMVQQRNEKHGADLTAWLNDPDNRAKLGDWISTNHIELETPASDIPTMEGPGLVDTGGPG